MYTSLLRMRSFARTPARRIPWVALCTFTVVELVFGGAACFAQGTAAQGDDLFARCASDMEKAPGDAYESCARFVKEAPPSDSENIQKAKRWLGRNAPKLPFVNYLKSLSSDDKQFVVYQPDLTIELPAVNRKTRTGQLKIARSYANLTEETMLRKAEAVYPAPSVMIHQLFYMWDGWPTGKLSEALEPIWGAPGNDEIMQTETITSSAVRYYYDLVMAAEKNPKTSSGFDVWHTDLDYAAGIHYLDRYKHGEDSYEDVYVASLDLTWGFTCGGLCGMGFTRNKIVVLGRHGEVIALYLDAPVNFENWVS